jgi:hypothetical protein
MGHRSPLVLLALLVAACVPQPGELSPTEALSAFLTAVEQSTHAPEQQQVAYEWVDLRSQEVLAKRAASAASLGGRSLKPWDMIVPGRLSFSSQPVASVAMRARIEADRAVVEVPLERGDKLEVPMAREQGRWRVVLGLSE